PDSLWLFLRCADSLSTLRWQLATRALLDSKTPKDTALPYPAGNIRSPATTARTHSSRRNGGITPDTFKVLRAATVSAISSLFSEPPLLLILAAASRRGRRAMSSLRILH